MAITYSLASNPHWVIIDNFSRLPNGAAIYTYSSLNPSQFKAAFTDASGQTAWDEPIVGFGNGTMPPIFWAFDSSNPADTYYIRVYDKPNTPGNNAQFLWDFDGISGGSGGGGGGTIVVASDIENLVVNNVFFRNIGDQTGTPSLPASLTLAPSTHQGFVNDPVNANVTANGPVGPDIVFAKKNNSASDNIKFINFALGSTDLSPNVTPQQYFQYNCTAPGASETYKYVQFPLSQGVQNLSGKTLIMRFYGRCTSGNTLIQLSYRQFFGSGGAPSADVTTNVAGSPFSLTSTFAATVVQTVIPSVAGKAIGTCGNDGLFFQVGLPRDAATSIDFIYPEIYLGTAVPIIEYDTHDQIDSLANTSRTGDIRISVNNFQPYGWVAMNDGTIANGSVGITAPVALGFARNNVDTFPLYDLLWNLPIAVVPEWEANGITVVAARGASSVADFTANRQLQLTKAAGRVFAGISSGHLIGTVDGFDSHNITTNEMAQHTHDSSAGAFVVAGGAQQTAPGVATFGSVAATGGITLYGGQTALSLLQPTTWMNVYIKL